MGKGTTAALGAAGVLGSGGIATLAAHQMGAFGGHANYVAITTAQLTSHNGHCLDKTFGEGKWDLSPAKPTPETSQTLVLDGTQSPKGCLAINREKEKTGDNWGGYFRFIWTLAKGTGGFVVYLSGKTDHSKAGGMTMNFEGAAHILKENKGKWKTIEKIEFDKKELSNDQMATTFPTLAIGDGSNPSSVHLNFLDNTTGKSVPPPEGKEQYYRYAGWVLKGDSGSQAQSINPWSTRINLWWKHFFGEDKWKLLDAIKDLKGKWVIGGETPNKPK